MKKEFLEFINLLEFVLKIQPWLIGGDFVKKNTSTLNLVEEKKTYLNKNVNDKVIT
jgi:hypothetical protein